MLPTQLRILRVFGLPAAEVASIVRTARDEGCPGLRLLERDGEFVVCIQASAPTQALAGEYCDRWVQRLRGRFGDALYATGETSLAQATLDALVKKRKLIVAADEATGRLLGSMLRPLAHSEAVFDYGNQTYADPERSKKITTPPSVLKKFPGDVMQAAASRAQLALSIGGADLGAVYMPATVGQAPFVLLCDKRTAVACAVNPDLSDAGIANTLLDLARRRVLGLHFSQGTVTFRPGHEHPLLLFSQAGQLKGGSRRFVPRQAPTPVAEPEESPVSSVRSFDTPEEAQDDTTWSFPFRSDSTATDAPLSLDFTTAGPQAAALSRAAHSAEPDLDLPDESPAPLFSVEETEEEDSDAPAPSLLDGDIPDFSHLLDPSTIAAANLADDASPPRSEEDFRRAASHLFDDDDDDDFVSSPIRRTIHRKADSDSFSDVPSKPIQKHEAPASQDAAPRSSALKNRSMALIERSERAHRRNCLIAAVLVLLLLVAFVVSAFLRSKPEAVEATAPVPASYGTPLYDETVLQYLADAQAAQKDVIGYLGFPSVDGRLVYSSSSKQPTDSETPRAIMVTTNWLGSTTPCNTVIDCSGTALKALTQAEGLRANACFTLTLPGTSYTCKVVAVYYTDAEGFDPRSYQDLSRYSDYLDFVLNTSIRSLFDTGVAVNDQAQFITLTSDSETPGVRLCVTGLILPEGERAPLSSSTITEAEAPLLSSVQYANAGQEQPDVAALLADAMAKFAEQSRS